METMIVVQTTESRVDAVRRVISEKKQRLHELHVSREAIRKAIAETEQDLGLAHAYLHSLELR